MPFDQSLIRELDKMRKILSLPGMERELIMFKGFIWYRLKIQVRVCAIGTVAHDMQVYSNSQCR